MCCQGVFNDFMTQRRERVIFFQALGGVGFSGGLR